MERLGITARDLARDYIRQQARELEQARLHWDEGRDDGSGVMEALAAFRNDDGGYGHGLEPDIRLPDSSVICTSVALQIMAEVSVPADHPMAHDAITYLIRTHDVAKGAWFQVPPNVDEAPHAPWWTYNPDISQQIANPGAELVSALYRFGHVPARWREALAEQMVAYAESHHAALTIPDLVCYRRLVETRELPEVLRQRLLSPLRAAVERLFLQNPDPERWAAMGMGPLAIAPTSDSLFATQLSELAQDALDRLVAEQQPDGSWAPAWSWEERHPEAWPQAEQEWRGVMTLEALRYLTAYGRIEAKGGDFPSEIKPVV
jgi:hypothetical protein